MVGRGGDMPQPDQSEVLEFLRSRVATGASTDDSAGIIETHISVVIMRGDTVWKLKRALQLPYLDFSTAELRAAACEQEIFLNRRTAPEIYRAVRRITREADGSLVFDGSGELVDAVVEMQRFDDSTLFSKLALAGGLEHTTLTTLARTVAAFHQHAEVHTLASGAKAIESVLTLNEQCAEMAPILGDAAVSELRASLRAGLQQHRILLDRRAAEGRVRRCHGDLHLRNICLFNGSPTLFDCIEFNDAIAIIDVLYDLAFLLMDLWQAGLRAEANWVMNRYMDESDETDGLPLLPFFMALRASIRAQVLATQAAMLDTVEREEIADQAKRYLDLAMRLLRGAPARLLAIGGLSGSGKSTVAAAVAHHIGAAPGARILATDRIRKRMAGVSPDTRLPPETYTQESSNRVYAALYEQAGQILKSGYSVIADAVFSKRDEQARIEHSATRAGVPFRGIWLDAHADTLIERVEARTGDPSDAGKEVVLAQLKRHGNRVEWTVVPAGGGRVEAAEGVLAVL